MSEEKDYTGTITGHVRSRDFLQGEWSVHTTLEEQTDGSWQASAMDGKYTAEGHTSVAAMEKLYETLYQEGLKGGY